MLGSSSQRGGGLIARSGFGLAVLLLPCGMCGAVDGLKLFEPPPPDGNRTNVGEAGFASLTEGTDAGRPCRSRCRRRAGLSIVPLRGP